MEWGGPELERYTGRHRPYLPTTPGTQVQLTAAAWCAGHRWRWRRGLGWLHRAGHRARLLRNRPPVPPPAGYVS